MKLAASASLALAFAFHSHALGQQFFTNRPAFLSNVSPSRYEETLNTFTEGDPLDGHQKIWEAPGDHGFNWDVTASGLGNQLLYSLAQAISTSAHEDTLVFTFTGDPVYAFGGDFWGTMYDGFPQTAEITFETDTGQSFTHLVTGRTFLGIVSNVPLSSVTITAASKQAAWATASAIVTGGLNPNADLDGDGMPNGAELAAGTDPGNPNSSLRITSAKVQNSQMILTFTAVAGKSYCLEVSNNPSSATWQPAGVGCFAAQTSGSAQFAIAAQQTRTFYRVRLSSP